MEDSSQLFLQWAMSTLQHEPQQPPAAVDDHCGQAAATFFPSLQQLRAAEMTEEELISGAHGAVSSWWSPVRASDRSGGHGWDPAAATDHDCPPPPNSASGRPPIIGGSNLLVSWNFSAAVAPPGSGSDSGMPEPVCGSSPPLAPTRRGRPKVAAPTSLASYGHDHIIAERKRREKINQRLVELSAVIPGLKKMDKATILADAARYVKELQGKIKALEAEKGDDVRSIGTVVLVGKPCHDDAVLEDEGGGSPLETPAAARKQLPEIEAWYSGNNMMLRILCENGKGVAVRVLARVEDLHLTIVDANVIPFPASTLITITITAKVEPGFTITVEEVIGRVTSAISQHHI